MNPISIPPPEWAAGSLTAGQKSRDPKAVDAAARDFEALFTAQVLKEMRQTLEPGSLFAGDSSDIQGGLFDLYLGKHLAQSGGFGVGDLVRRQLLGRPRA